MKSTANLLDFITKVEYYNKIIPDVNNRTVAD